MQCYYAPIGGRNDFNHVVGRESIELIEQFAERSLDLSLPRLVAAFTLGTDCVQFVDKNNDACRIAVVELFLGELERVSHHLRTITDVHLHELGAGQFEKGSVGLSCAGPSQEGLAGARGTVKEDALGWSDADGLEHIIVRHR